MGNAKSKDDEHQLEEVVVTGNKHCTNFTCIYDNNNLLAKCVAGQTSGTNHDEYSATLIPFDEQDEANYATEPGIYLCEEYWAVLPDVHIWQIW